MMLDFNHRNAVVTGGAGGIGLATALRLAKGGARVFLVDRSERGLNEAFARFAELELPVETFVADVTSAEETKGYVQRALDVLGGIDLLFNNAGIDGPMRPIFDFPEEEFDRVIAVNLRGVFLGMRYVLPVMRRKGAGAIVNTGSLASERGLPGGVAYVATKHAVLGMTRTAAADLGNSGIRVNCVMPGMVDTPLLRRIITTTFNGELEMGLKNIANVAPLGRCAAPDEIAAAVTFLLHDQASYLNGVGLAVDGGALATMSNSG